MNNQELKEKTAHGTHLFPFSVYTYTMFKDRIGVYAHWHDEIEFFWQQEGKSILYIEGENVYVDEGDIIVINPKQLHGADAQTDKSKFKAFVFNLKFLSSNTSDIVYYKYILPIEKNGIKLVKVIGDSNENKAIQSYLKQIEICYQNKIYGYEIIIKSFLLYILGIFFTNNLFEEVITTLESRNLDKIKPIFEYIHENYSNKMSIEELSKVINMSKYHFCRLFKKVTKMRPSEYINHVRIKKAQEILKEDKNISDVAFEVGFENISYFTRCFKKIVGITPREYQKQLKMSG